ncbi:MAG: hypothetical protein ACLUVF_10375, partial [Adlercreutzia sp.]
MSSVVAPVGALLCLVLPFAELLCLNKCSADLVDKLEFAFLTMPVRTASFAALAIAVDEHHLARTFHG